MVYRAKVQEWFEYQPSSLSSHALAIGRHMSAYRSYIEAQRYLSSKATDVKILARAFTRLPNLETLHLDYWNHAVGSLELIDAFGRFVAADLVTLNCEYVLPTLFRALSSSRTKFKVFKLGPDYESDFHYSHGADLSTASRARASLVPLSHAELSSRASTSNPDRITVDALSKTFRASNDEICRSALINLRELRIGEMTICNSDAELSRFTAAIKMMIASATDIEEIVFKEIDLNHRGSRPSLTAMIPTYPLRNLRVLEVYNYQTTLRALTDFFRHHRRSLVNVELESVRIVDSDWSIALVRLREIDFACLELFTLHCCDEQEEQLGVQDYILKESDEDPLVELRKYWAEQEALELGQTLAA